MADKSSNNKEFQNFVDLLKKKVAAGEMKGVELFLFTDNVVTKYF